MKTLQGVRVVEFSHMVAGPACGQVLADFGAEVIKVEPAQGDITRRLGPDAGGVSALFATTNRGKRSVRLDLKDPRHARAAVRLATTADVVVSNIDAGMLGRAGLSRQALRQTNPGLIWVDISAFGPGGALGTDGIAQAATGLMSVTGDASGGTYRTGASVVDVSTGVWAALGVLAALENRRKTGRGDHLSVSLADVCLYMQYSQLAMFDADPGAVRRNGNHSMISCTPIFDASDGRLMTTILHDRHWETLCGLVGRPDLVAHRDFMTNDQRCERQGEIEALLNPSFAAGTRTHWLEMLRAARIPCAPERDYGEVTADPALRQAGTLFELPTPRGQALHVACPVRFTAHPPPAPRPAAGLGADDDALLVPLRDMVGDSDVTGVGATGAGRVGGDRRDE